MQETSNDLTAKIPKTHFANVVDAYAFWLGQEAHTSKSHSRGRQRLAAKVGVCMQLVFCLPNLTTLGDFACHVTYALIKIYNF